MASETNDEKIGPTAHYTAYVWHRLGMPHAELFKTALGRTAFWGFRLAGEGLLTFHPTIPSMKQYLEIRHRLIEQAVFDEDPDVVVELGAGLSRRGVTWAERGVRYVEVDLPHMIKKKRELLERAPRAFRKRIAGSFSQAASDVLAPDFPDRLRSFLGDAERPLVIAEGLLGYFAMEDRKTAVRSVADALAGRGALLAELRHAEEGGRALSVAVNLTKAGIRLLTSGRGAREDFASLEMARLFLLDAGFKSADPLETDTLGDLARKQPPARIWRANAG